MCTKRQSHTLTKICVPGELPIWVSQYRNQTNSYRNELSKSQILTTMGPYLERSQHGESINPTPHSRPLMTWPLHIALPCLSVNWPGGDRYKNTNINIQRSSSWAILLVVLIPWWGSYTNLEDKRCWNRFFTIYNFQGCHIYPLQYPSLKSEYWQLLAFTAIPLFVLSCPWLAIHFSTFLPLARNTWIRDSVTSLSKLFTTTIRCCNINYLQRILQPLHQKVSECPSLLIFEFKKRI